MTRWILPSLLGLLLLSACGNGNGGGAGAGGGEAAGDTTCPQEEVSTASGLKIRDIECGEGEEAVPGATVSVHYVGTLDSGEQFDSSRERNQPFQFALGSGQVIPGWDEGIQGMKVGGVRELTIPPDLGYGAAGSPPVIPPNATLHFEVELLEIL